MSLINASTKKNMQDDTVTAEHLGPVFLPISLVRDSDNLHERRQNAPLYANIPSNLSNCC